MRLPAFVLFLATPGFLSAQPAEIKPIPPKGVAVSDQTKKELRAGLDELGGMIEELRKSLKPPQAELLPDVEIYHKAVRYALENDEIYAEGKRDDAKSCLALLFDGRRRAEELKRGRPSWTDLGGSVVRGYRSKIDGSVQPYAVMVPPNYAFNPSNPKNNRSYRCDFWWHGRGELLTEVNFIMGRNNPRDDFTPATAFVIHPYGRYCNANKFAGEVDTFECLEHAKKYYRIDESKLVARGFSMGGAACWQYATHFPTVWAAAAPGAGFAETREFLRDFRGDRERPTWWEERLWRMYDSTVYSQNLFNLPTVAYSGENDGQKQAADVMAREMKKVGLELDHVIGPNTKHQYEPGAKKIINEKIDPIANKGRDPLPKEIKFVTYTLRYEQCAWVTVEGLARHWEKGSVFGTWNDGKADLKTEGVTALSIPVEPVKGKRLLELTIDGAKVWTAGPPNPSSAVARVGLRKVDGKWEALTKGDLLKPAELTKVHALQGPIDDAFMDRFLMVRPTGKPLHETAGTWVAGEMKHAVEHWRNQFRGDAPVKDDKDVTADDIANSNLVLWGDPASNVLLAKVIDKLPVKWTKDGVEFGGQKYDAATHVPVMIFPNPLNPKKYVVLHSGFTFREYAYLNNARQIPKLPDYAILDVTVPADKVWPAKVVRAGFFGEKWELLKDDGK